MNAVEPVLQGLCSSDQVLEPPSNAVGISEVAGGGPVEVEDWDRRRLIPLLTRQKRHFPTGWPYIHFSRLLNTTIRNLLSPRWALKNQSRNFIWE